MTNGQSLIETFLELARIDGPSGKERPVADHLRRRLEELGLTVREDDAHVQEGGGNCGNLVATWGDGGDLALTAHMDTARPTGAVRPIVHADRITSDGATVLGVDDRAGMAMLLDAAERVVRGGGRKGFTLGFTIAEETTLAGSRRIDLGPGVRQAVLFDSSLRPGAVVCRSYGCRKISVAVRGRAAHSGIAPERGISAIAAAAKAIAALPLGRIDDETTSNVGLIRGGSAINVVPEETTLEAEVRALREERAEEIAARFVAAFRDEAARAGAEARIRDEWDFRPYEIAPESPLFRRVAAALRAVGLEPTTRTSAGGSDANSFNARGLPAINIGVGAQNPHGDDEFILLEDLDKGAEIAFALLA